MRIRRRQSGFTLAEMLIGLMVSSIILAAAATISYAMNSAETTVDDLHKNQAVLRHANVRIRDLIRNANSVLTANAWSIELWADSDYDGVIEASEKYSILIGMDMASIHLMDGAGIMMAIIPKCSNIQFIIDKAVPDTEMVTVMFDMEVNDSTNTYQISGTLLCKDDHM